jgi:hypothetical protein
MKISTLGEYIEVINDLFFNRWGCMSGDIWFRGVSNENHQLIPKIKRYNNVDSRLEDTIIEEFLNSYPVYSDKEVRDSWEKYALMQHYNLPTRLLDWSKSPLVALYFALNNENTDGCVWCIDPFILNKTTTGKETIFTPKIANTDDGVNVSLYLPQILRDNNKILANKPIAIETPLSNKRISSQQGCFTVHGSEDGCISSYCQDRLEKIIINKTNKKNIKDELENMGFREDFIWQSLDSLSRRITKDHLE